MYDDFYMYDEVEVYVYECDICKSTVKSRAIKKCLVCEKRLCENKGCNVRGFCINHYDILPPEGRIKFNQIAKEQEEDIKNSNFGENCILIIIILTSFLLIAFYFTLYLIDDLKFIYDWLGLIISLTFIGIGLMIFDIIALAFNNYNINQKCKYHDQEKLMIFSKYRKIE